MTPACLAKLLSQSPAAPKRRPDYPSRHPTAREAVDSVRLQIQENKQAIAPVKRRGACRIDSSEPHMRPTFRPDLSPGLNRQWPDCAR